MIFTTLRLGKKDVKVNDSDIFLSA